MRETIKEHDRDIPFARTQTSMNNEHIFYYMDSQSP